MTPADSAPAIGRHVRVAGRVQGVFFRGWTKQQADALGICGWVRNRRDGSVEALLSGRPAALDELIERMRRGPPGAQVTRLDSDDAPPAAEPGFAIRATA